MPVVLLAWCTPVAWAAPSHVTLDLTGLGAGGLQLQVALYDNSGVIGDSWAWLDNVVLGTAVDDFETGTPGAFDAGLNPLSVHAVAGSLTGTGRYVLRIEEDPLVTPTIALRNYAGPGGSVLSFDFEFATTGAAGLLGPDELVFSLLAPQTLAPLTSGLTGLGEVLVVNAGGTEYTDSTVVTAVPIPAPAAWVLGLLGVGTLKLARDNRKRNQKAKGKDQNCGIGFAEGAF